MAAEPTISAGGKALPFSAASADTAGLVDAANARRRIEGLPDTLNPAIIDPAKARSFVAALPKQSAAVMDKIAGADLSLGWAALGLGAATPTRAEAFGAPFTLVVDEIRGGHVLAHTTVPLDPALAKSRALEAQAALQQAEAAVRAVEQQASPPSGALGNARLRRSAIADTWRLNARAWADGNAGDAAANAALAEADKAAKAYFMPAGIQPD